MKKLKRGDRVVVITGKYKKEQGTISRVLTDGRVIVSGINMIKKHVRPNPMRNVPGGIIEKEAPIHASNVAIFNPDTQKADRVGFKFLEDGAKVRIYKSTKEIIEDNV